MADLRYIVPDLFRAEEVERSLGREWLCPFCRSQSTRAKKGEADIDWVASPLRQQEPKWICEGCCIDIYSTCLSPDYDDHPYKDIVEEAAKQERITAAEARRICLQHQHDIIENRCPNGNYGRYEEVYREIISLLKQIAGNQ